MGDKTSAAERILRLKHFFFSFSLLQAQGPSRKFWMFRRRRRLKPAMAPQASQARPGD